LSTAAGKARGKSSHTVHDSEPPLEFGTIVVVGGGCYGSQYVRQLRRARAAGRASFDRLIVVDQHAACAFEVTRGGDPGGQVDLAVPDAWKRIEFITSEWRPFFDEWLAAAVANPDEHTRDAIVPSPLMPHLLFEWLLARARVLARRELPVVMPAEIAGVPWQKEGGDGTRYVSYATWMCPINCVEPAKCPHTRGPRDWSFHSALLADAPGGALALLRVTHRTFGVGMIDVADVIAAHDLMRREVGAGRGLRVATASHCHGAVAAIGA
jgi:hypothetical protein